MKLSDGITSGFGQTAAQSKPLRRKTLVPVIVAMACLVCGCRQSQLQASQKMQEVTCNDITVFRNQPVDVTGACVYETGKEVNAAYVSADTSSVDIAKNGTYSMVVTVSDKSGNISLHDAFTETTDNHGEVAFRLLAVLFHGKTGPLLAAIGLYDMAMTARFFWKNCVNKAFTLLLFFPTVLMTYYFSAIRQGIVLATFLGVGISLAHYPS